MGSIRLSNIADGIEDWELFHKLGANASISTAADLITQLVSNETMRVENPQLLEKVRRQAAKNPRVTPLAQRNEKIKVRKCSSTIVTETTAFGQQDGIQC